MQRPRAVHVLLACLIAVAAVGVRAQAADDRHALSSRGGTLSLGGKPFFPGCNAEAPC